MGYLAYDTLNPRMYILASNVDAVVIQSTKEEAKLMLLNNLATSQNSLEPNFTISASNENFNINKNSNVLSSFQYLNNESIQLVDVNKTNKIIFNESDGIIDDNPGIGLSNNELFVQLNNNIFQIKQNSNVLLSSVYDSITSESRLGIGITNPTYALQVEGSIYSSGTIVASNLTIIGDTVTLDTITSNTEQMVITNMGNGPAILVSQTGENSIAEFYDDGALSLIIADGGYIGIGVSEPTEKLDIDGNATLTGDINVTNVNLTGDIYYNGVSIDIGNSAYSWKLDQATSNLYYLYGNIGIGTSTPSKELHVIGDTLIDGIITTNNNNINAGTGTITAASFIGTASNVEHSLQTGNYLLGADYDGSSNIIWNVNATSANDINKIVARDASGNFSAGTITATLSGTATQVSNTLTRGNYLTGNNFDGSSATTWAVDADSNNTANKIVVRDSSGNFSAGTITANLIGNASTSTTAGKVANSLVAGNYISGSSFDGSSTVTWNINASSNNISNEIVVRDSSSKIFASGIGIGTTTTSVPLHIEGQSYLNGTVTTNNNNINAGSGTVTAATFSGTATQVSNTLTRGNYLTGNNFNGSAATTWAVDADSNNTASKIVVRDTSGNFSAGIITATLNGTASNVEYSLTAGDYLLGAAYDGSSNITWSIDGTTTSTPDKVVIRDSSANIFANGIGIGTATTSVPLHVEGISYLNGNVGIGTANSSHSLTIHSSSSVLTVDNGKIGISKSTAITPSTDIEIRNNSDTSYTGILVTNNGNVNSGASLRIKGRRFDNSSNIAYSANIGLLRQNDNALLGTNIPLGLIHFGGNHTVAAGATGESSSNLYTSYIGAVSEDSFLSSSSMPTSIVLRSGSSGYNYYDNTIYHENSNIAVLHSSGNFGIGTNTPAYKLDVDGDINFNGILYQNGSEFVSGVSSEWTSNLNGSIYYNGGNIGIGTDNPTEKLHVEGNIYSSGTIIASNLSILGDTTILNTITSNTEQIIVINDGSGPALQVTQTGSQPIADFYDDGNVLVLRIADGGNIGIGTDNPTKTLDVNGDINFNGTLYQNGSEFVSGVSSEWTSNLDGSIYYNSGYIGINTDSPTTYLHVEGTSYLNGTITTNNNDINAGSGTVTAATFNGTLNGTASNIENQLSPGNYILGASYDGASDITWDINATNVNTVSTIVARDASGDFSAGTITATLSGTATQVSNTLIIGSYLTGDNFDGSAASTIAIDGTTTPDANKVVIRDASSNIFAGGVGIGTLTTSVPLHVVGESYLYGTVTTNNNDINAGSGTVTAATFSGTATQVSNTLTIGSYLTGDNFDGSAASTIAVDGTTTPDANKVVIRDASSNIFAGGVGIGTLTASVPLHVVGESYLYGTVTTNNNDINAGSGTVTAATFSGTLNGTASNVENQLSPGNYILGASYDGASDITWDINATNANTVSTIVARDASGNFSAGTITASLTGTATQVSNTLIIGSYLTGDNFDGSAASTIAIDGTTTPDANKVVIRDASSNIFAGGVGIGTATTSVPLHVEGISYFNGNVGIGTVNPTEKLYVDGNIHSSGIITASNLVVLGDYVTLNTITSNTEQVVVINDGSGPALQVTQTGAQPIADFYDDGSVLVFRIDDGGYIGINTDSPTTYLHVEGTSYLNGTVTTNNNDINVGSGTVTAATFSGTLDGTASNVENQLSPGNYILGASYDGASDITWDINATNANTVNTIVARDASGDFSAGTITATLSGTATQVSNTLTVGSYLTGDNFDGSAASTIAVDGTITPDANKVVIRDASSNIFAGGVGIGTITTSVPLYVVGESYLYGTVTTNNNDINAGSGTVTATTFSGTLDGTASNVENQLSPGNYILGASYDGASDITWDINATNANTVSTIVARDASGDFSAGTITATLSGTATQVSNTLTVGSYLTGDNFDGSTASTIAVDGTTSPDANKVVVRDASSNIFAGGVGIGTNSLSSYELDIVGDINFTGILYQNGSEFVSSEWTSNIDGSIYYNEGNIGIGTITPTKTLHVNGDLYADYVYTSNIIYTEYDNLSKLQLVPIKYTTRLTDSSTSNFVFVYEGIFKSSGNYTDVHLNGHKLGYSNEDINDYTVSYSNDYTNINTTYTITLFEAPTQGSVVDIMLWPQYLDNYSYSNQPSNFYQTVNTSSEFSQGLNNNIYYDLGNVGIGTANPTNTLDIIGQVTITAPVTQSKPAIYINNFSSTYGEIAVETGGRLSLGQWSGTAFTEYIGINGGSGNVEIINSRIEAHQTLRCYGNDGSIAGTSHTGQKQLFIADDSTHGWWLGCQTSPSDTDNELCFMINENGNEALVAVLLDNTYNQQITTSFTGQHRCFVYNKSYSELINYEGLIVSANKNKFIKISGGVSIGQEAITISETLPIVDITSVAKDKAVFGVISTIEDPEGREEQHGNFVSIHKKELGDTRAYINSLGEGAIWICDINGNLESGDYITSSVVSGYGMKQDSEFLANYTVAKITMDCDFNPIDIPKLIIKKKTVIENGESKDINDLDSKGNIQWVNETYSDGNNIYEKEYKTRYLNSSGEIITEEEYNSNIANNIPSYKAAFVGCTYHCG